MGPRLRRGTGLFLDVGRMSYRCDYTLDDAERIGAAIGTALIGALPASPATTFGWVMLVGTVSAMVIFFPVIARSCRPAIADI